MEKKKEKEKSPWKYLRMLWFSMAINKMLPTLFWMPMIILQNRIDSFWNFLWNLITYKEFNTNNFTGSIQYCFYCLICIFQYTYYNNRFLYGIFILVHLTLSTPPWASTFASTLVVSCIYIFVFLHLSLTLLKPLILPHVLLCFDFHICVCDVYGYEFYAYEVYV